MSVVLLKCGHCQKEYCQEKELFADTCGHHKCRECILSAIDNSCSQCTMTCSGVAQAKSMNEKFPQKTKKESKVSKQTHIVEELSAVGTIQYHCTACGKIFRSRSQKYYHLECNQPTDALYECDICKKTFTRHSQFKYHSESHASPINECPMCHKTFSNPLALKKHEALHKVEPKPCPHCEKTFLKKISLEQHIAAQHLHQLQYGCAYCNKKYASKSTLQLHLQSHEKKRFECSFCGKHYQRNSILNLHLKRHNHTDTYKCKKCDKVFRESGALARHRKIHEENATQFNCKLCDKNILRKDNMTRHVNTIHPEEIFDDIVLIVKQFAENENNLQQSEMSEGHYPLEDGEKLDIEEQTYFERSYNKPPRTENKVFAKDNANTKVCEKKEINLQNNFVIIENRVLQNAKEIQNIESAFEDDKLCRTTDDLSILNPSREFAGDYINLDSKASTNCKQAIVTHVEVINTFSSINEKTNDDLSENKGNTMTTENQIEYNSSLLLKLEQNITFSGSLSKSTSENKLLNVVLAPNKQTNSLYVKPQNLKSSITNTKPQKVSYDFNSSPTATHFSETNDLPVHNKASVIRSIGNVKKMLIPSITTVTKSIVPNNLLLDCEYKHKKYSRHYNVDLYRKILGCDDEDNNDDDDNGEEDQHHCNHQTGKQENSCDATNATPVHWRKSFKNSYETSTL